MKGALPYLFVVVAVVVGLLTLGGGDPHRYHQSHGLMGHETNEVLPAHRYPAGVVRETYQMAAEVSEVIDQLFCYCFCSDHSGHKSLLTCFTNDHGANCAICINEVRTAYRLSKAGLPIEEIQEAIDAQYARPG